jgi:hypothetical protein
VTTWDAWREAHIKRFPPRDLLSVDELWREHFAELPREQALECFAVIEREFQLSIGFLRADDSLTALFAPVPTWNPWRWVSFRVLESDGVTEIWHQLERQLKRHGTDGLWTEIRTFVDFVRSWCGEKPRRSS